MPEPDANPNHDSLPGPSLDDVARVARLSRLALDEAGILAARADLTAILEHVAAIGTLQVEGVEPMARPHDQVNRLAEDVPGPMLDRGTVLGLAPDVEGDYIAVPKVLGEGGA